MKNLIVYILLIFTFTGCYKYETGTTLTLSGKYVINRITIKSVDQNQTGDSTYRHGDIFIDSTPQTPIPFNRIHVGYTFIHFDNVLVNLRYMGVNNHGQDLWDRRYETWYRILGNNRWQEGYLQFSYNDPVLTGANHTCTFQITEDKFESLELVSSGKWPSYKFGEKKILILSLLRVGP